MTDWSVEDLTRLSAARLRFARLRQAQHGSKSTTEMRIALVAFERGLSDRELEQFYYVNRKGAKKRYFDHDAFAKKYGVSVDWIRDGDLCEHPRGLKRQRCPASDARREAQRLNREAKDAIRERIRMFAASRDLTPEQIKPAMTTKHFLLATFAQEHSVSIEWLIAGTIAQADDTKGGAATGQTGDIWRGIFRASLTPGNADSWIV